MTPRPYFGPLPSALSGLSLLSRLSLLSLLVGCAGSDKPAGDSPRPDSPLPTDSVTESTDDTAPEGSCGDGVLARPELCDDGELNGQTPCGCQLDCRYLPAATPCIDPSVCAVDGRCDGAGSCVAPADTCDDGNLCTVDRCDAVTSACVHEEPSSPAELYDLGSLLDMSTLDVEVLSTETVSAVTGDVTIQEIRFTSYASEGCVATPIRLQAWLAVPELAATTPVPGLAIAHGLGGLADREEALEVAGTLPVVALSWSGPGCGESEGTAYVADHLFDMDGITDSWFWEHTVAGARALTVLEAAPAVDKSRLGITGTSAGGIITYTLAAIDPRVDVAIPISSSGFLDPAVRATPVPSYWAGVLESMDPPTGPDDTPWAEFQAWYDPLHHLANNHADTFIVSGTQDQFFPIDAVTSTFGALASGEHRLLMLTDWDHGISDFDAAAADQAMVGARNFWLMSRWNLDPALATPPPTPPDPGVAACPDARACSLVLAELPLSGYVPLSVAFSWSTDQALTWTTTELAPSGPTLWAGEVGLDATRYDGSNTAWMLRVDYAIGPDTLSLTSVPHLPPGFVPNILPEE